MKKLFLAAAAACVMVSGAAIAAVNVDNDGYGWVGKGDVQLAFGWNNKDAQTKGLNVAFSQQFEDSYDVTCYWETTTGGPKSKIVPHAVTNSRVYSVSSSVSYDPRKTGQYTGYTLKGAGAGTVVGTPAPKVGDACPHGGGFSSSDPEENDAVVTAVDMVSSTGGLFVSYGGTKVALPNTPVATTF